MAMVGKMGEAMADAEVEAMVEGGVKLIEAMLIDQRGEALELHILPWSMW